MKKISLILAALLATILTLSACAVAPAEPAATPEPTAEAAVTNTPGADALRAKNSRSATATALTLLRSHRGLRSVNRFTGAPGELGWIGTLWPGC